MSKRIELDPKPEYVYVTIPSEYVCIYHKLLAMMADFGEDMLKDCKASCTDRNSSVIECYNMFNSAIAARTIGKGKLAETLIKYIKTKINQVYKGNETNPGYVFPVDEKGHIKAFVSCNDRPRFFINSDDAVLYKQEMGLGTKEEYHLDKRDFGETNIPITPPINDAFDCLLDATISSTGELTINTTYYFNGEEIKDVENIREDFYFDKAFIINPSDVKDISYGMHSITLVAEYDNHIITKEYIVTRNLTE